MFWLRVVSWNLRHGGLDGELRGDPDRLWRQVAVLAKLEPDLLALQEAKWGAAGSWLLNEVAHRLSMSYRVLVPSNHHGCDQAMLVRERPGLRVVRDCHDLSASWWHALGDLELEVAGEQPVHFLAVHLAPSSPAMRLAEAEGFQLFRERRVIAACGDFNGVPSGGEFEYLDGMIGGPIPDHVARKLNTAPAEAIRAAGFRDAADVAGDHTPTVGYTVQGGLAFRCDWILYNMPGVVVRHYEVSIADGRADSDHRPVVADLTW